MNSISNVSFYKVNKADNEEFLSSAANFCSWSVVSLALALLQVVLFLHEQIDLKQFLCFVSLLKACFHVRYESELRIPPFKKKKKMKTVQTKTGRDERSG